MVWFDSSYNMDNGNISICWVGRLQYNGFEKQVDYFKNNNIISHQRPAMHAESLSTGNIKMNTMKILIKYFFLFKIRFHLLANIFNLAFCAETL